MSLETLAKGPYIKDAPRHQLGSRTTGAIHTNTFHEDGFCLKDLKTFETKVE